MRIPYKDRVGQKFNMVTVLRITATENSAKRGWVKGRCDVRCDCGKEFNARIESVLQGNTSSCGCSRRKYHNSGLGTIFNRYRNSANGKGFEFKLSVDELEAVITKDCHYCGSNASRTVVEGNDEFVCNGIDRIDSSKGYIIGNILPCCSICNYAKRDMSYADFILWIKQLKSYEIQGDSEGNGMMIHTAKKGEGICVSDYHKRYGNALVAVARVY
jgi:hypothetical protein